jgi:hypothetical protein
LLDAFAPTRGRVRNIKIKTTSNNVLLSVFMCPPFRQSFILELTGLLRCARNDQVKIIKNLSDFK